MHNTKNVDNKNVDNKDVKDLNITNKTVAEVEEDIRLAKVARDASEQKDPETSTIRDARVATEEKALEDARNGTAENGEGKNLGDAFAKKGKEESKKSE